MDEGELARLFGDNAQCCGARNAEQQVPAESGYYAIFVASSEGLPAIFSQYCEDAGPKLIYIGIARKSLLKRLVEQDLRHVGSSSFFRSLGAVLGHRPPRGSLFGRKNRTNYRFSSEDTKLIIEWINLNLWIRWVCDGHASLEKEREAIKVRAPLFNITHNPLPAPQLLEVREQCRTIARQAPVGVES
jgi:hypothetical protein